MSRSRKQENPEHVVGSEEPSAARTKNVQTAAVEVLPLRPPLRTAAPAPPPGPFDALVREVAHALVRLAADNPDLLRQVIGAVSGSGSAGDAGRLLMSKGEYAERVGFSVRTLDKFIEAGLPTFGSGKRLRVVVAKADEWLLRQDSEHLDEIDLLAMQNAGKRPRAGGNGE